ncbi:MAG: phosphate ABC transporter substrate-binding protein PstS [Gaiellaceae bacterium]
MRRHGMFMGLTLAIVATVAVAALTVGAASARTAKSIVTGAGSTFVAPLVQSWIGPVSSIGISLQYSAVGSGGGVSAITNHQVQFGASDAPLSQFSPTCNTCVQIPWALAGTAVMYRLDGAKNHLHLTGQVLAQIYLGQIKSWNAKSIRKLNPGVSLPNKSITVVHRSDSSGTSYNLTDYLSHVSSAWKNGPGTGTNVAWPIGVGGKGSSSVASLVRQTNGAIGYADAEYAHRAHLAMFSLKNKAGKFEFPTLKSIEAASLLDTKPAKNGSLSIVDPPAGSKYANAYPISTYTYVDVQRSTPNAAPIKKLLSWAITKGQSYGPKIFFVPLPAPVVTFDKGQIKKIK